MSRRSRCSHGGTSVSASRPTAARALLAAITVLVLTARATAQTEVTTPVSPTPPPTPRPPPPPPTRPPFTPRPTATPTLTPTSTGLRDGEILRQIFDLTGGSNWTNCTELGVPGHDPCAPGQTPGCARCGVNDVGSPEPESRWVTYINLTAVGMVGQIPPAFCDLTRLDSLDLGYNNLNGSVPDCIGNLPLSVLAIHNNQLVGNLTSNNTVTAPLPTPGAGTPDQIDDPAAAAAAVGGGLSRLLCRLRNTVRFLKIGGNRFNGTIPTCFSQMKQMHELGIFGNGLTGNITDILQSLTCDLGSFSGGQLRTIDLSDNNFTGAVVKCSVEPDTQSRLTTVSLAQNKLEGNMTEWLCQSYVTAQGDFYFGQLENLFMGFNGFVGPIPPCLGAKQWRGRFGNGGFTNLQRLDVFRNRLTGSLETNNTICNLKSLRILSMGSNQLSGGVISPCVWELPLQRVNLRQLGLRGPLTSAVLCKPDSELVALDIGGNSFTGSILDCIANLTKLQYLNLLDSTLSGRLPTNLFLLPELRTLLISGANFDGGLPASDRPTAAQLQLLLNSNPRIANTYRGEGRWLPRIEVLGMPSCGLTGGIPAWLGNRSTLTTVTLSGNQLTGELPVFAANGSLRQLYISGMQINGTLNPLAKVSNLERLDISQNAISGTVPDWLGERSEGMTEISLFDNYLSCELPAIGGTADVDLLRGNLFGCPIDDQTRSRDRNGLSYECGSVGRNYALYYVMVLSVAVTVICTYLCLGTYGTEPAPAPAALTGGGAHRPKALSSFVFQTSIAVAVFWLFGLGAIFATAPSRLTCQYGWRVTAGFLEALPAPGGFWVYGLVVIGGFGAGGLLLLFLLIPGLYHDVVQRPKYVKKLKLWWQRGGRGSASGSVSSAGSAWSDAVVLTGLGRVVGARTPSTSSTAEGAAAAVPEPEHPGEGKRLHRRWIVAALMVATSAVTVALGVNVGFVMIEESPHLDSAVKDMVVVIFAVIHELIDTVASPHVLRLLMELLAYHRDGYSHRHNASAEPVSGETLFRWVVAMELFNSLMAPLIAFVFASNGCLGEYFSPPSAVTTEITFQSCSDYFIDYNGDVGQCILNSTNVIPSKYTPQFEFRGPRCIDSVITLYSPAYLMVFVVRTILLAPAWILMRRGTPWLLAGASPVQRVVRPSRPAATTTTATAPEGTQTQTLTPASARNPYTSSVVSVVRFQDEVDQAAKHAVHSRRKSAKKVDKIRAIERDSFAINCLSIGLCGGMLSPLVSVAACLCLAARWAIHKALDRLFLRRWPGEVDYLPVQTHSMPVECIAYILLYHSLWFTLFVTSAGFLGGAAMVLVFNWLAFFIAAAWVRPPSKSFADVAVLAMAANVDKPGADVSRQARGGRAAAGSAWAKASPAAVLALAANDSTLNEPLLNDNPAL